MHFFHPVFSRAEDLIMTPLSNIPSVPFILKYLTDYYNETKLRQIASSLCLSGSLLVMCQLLFSATQLCFFPYRCSNNIYYRSTDIPSECYGCSLFTPKLALPASTLEILSVVPDMAPVLIHRFLFE